MSTGIYMCVCVRACVRARARAHVYMSMKAMFLETLGVLN